MSYRPRIVDAQINKLLHIMGFVLIEGPKAVGKSETARQIAKSVIKLDLEPAAQELARVSPGLLLAGEVPVLIDEWQIVPELWSWVKFEVDTRQLPGQFILTGSAVPADEITRDTAAGRLARLKMRPMSLFETGHSAGTVSLATLFSGAIPNAPDSGLSLQLLVERICAGGWPAFQKLNVNDASFAMSTYLDEIAGIDLQRVSGVKFNKLNVLRVLKSLARNVGTKASYSTISADIRTEGNVVNRQVIAEYLEALQRLMIIEDNPPWAPHLRSRDRLNVASTRYFIDPSLAVVALGASPTTLLGGEIKYLGFLFENLALRDLRVYMQPIMGRVFQYRDDSGLEVDVILETPDNQWAAIEIKLSFDQVENAAANLLRFKSKIDTDICGEPAFMAVLTSTGANYVRKDGIYVISIGSLAP